MRRERCRALALVGRLIGLVLAPALLLAACGGSQVDEAESGTVAGRIAESELSPGKSASATFTLTPGSYVLLCTIPGHYKDGMRTAFKVLSGDGPREASVDVELGEWFVTVPNASQSAGSITFRAVNKGGQSHNLVVIRTDLAPDALVTK